MTISFSDLQLACGGCGFEITLGVSAPVEAMPVASGCSLCGLLSGLQVVTATELLAGVSVPPAGKCPGCGTPTTGVVIDTLDWTRRLLPGSGMRIPDVQCPDCHAAQLVAADDERVAGPPL